MPYLADGRWFIIIIGAYLLLFSWTRARYPRSSESKSQTGIRPPFGGIFKVVVVSIAGDIELDFIPIGTVEEGKCGEADGNSISDFTVQFQDGDIEQLITTLSDITVKQMDSGNVYYGRITVIWAYFVTLYSESGSHCSLESRVP